MGNTCPRKECGSVLNYSHNAQKTEWGDVAGDFTAYEDVTLYSCKKCNIEFEIMKSFMDVHRTFLRFVPPKYFWDERKNWRCTTCANNLQRQDFRCTTCYWDIRPMSVNDMGNFLNIYFDAEVPKEVISKILLFIPTKL
jgi:hypothetical protein